MIIEFLLYKQLLFFFHNQRLHFHTFPIKIIEESNFLIINNINRFSELRKINGFFEARCVFVRTNFSSCAYKDDLAFLQKGRNHSELVVLILENLQKLFCSMWSENDSQLSEVIEDWR